MPIRVTCACGKVFRVKDEFAGRQVQCQVCQGTVMVPEADGGALADPPAPAASVAAPSAAPAAAPPAPQAKASQPMRECPDCAEQIPAKSAFCPLCGSKLTAELGADQAAQLLQDSLKALDDHVGDRQALAMDEDLKGKYLTTKSMVLMVITALSLGLAVLGGLTGRDGEWMIVVGIILIAIFGIASLVSLVNDHRTFGIQGARSPDTALKNFLLAAKTGRSGRAFICLAPKARETATAHTVTFEKIPANEDSYSIRDVASFKKYWKSIFKGPSGQTRSAQVKKVRVVKESGNGLALVEANIHFTSYPSLLILTVLINLILCVLLIVILQKREQKMVRKLMAKRDNRWYILDGEFQGKLDQAAKL